MISLGTIKGTTGIHITNLGGAGAATLPDGIQVVQAINGATGSAGAFSLAGPVSAGAFDYYVFKGGVTPGTAENYYLRSTIPVAPIDPVIIVPLPEPVPGTPTLPPNPGITPIPIYRPRFPCMRRCFLPPNRLCKGCWARITSVWVTRASSNKPGRSRLAGAGFTVAARARALPVRSNSTCWHLCWA